MKTLRNDPTLQGVAKGKLNSIYSELLDIDSKKAIKVINWFLDKSKYFNKTKYPFLPQNMSRGDIVRAYFGVNIPPEFSDEDTDGHFVLIWMQQGHNFIVIPLTKQAQPKSNVLGVNLGKIDGMPEVVDTYAKVDAMRSVSIRRIRRINEKSDGKITIKDEKVLKKIKDVFQEYFI
ncbi:MAG: type II toxin-antitoxin system PemK/MazF family toxin [Clostridiaceae bacterium]|nr:type II toxin-antitoxin system PemK/MazF family toxin [Clostridiaceae bacterium]